MNHMADARSVYIQHVLNCEGGSLTRAFGSSAEQKNDVPSRIGTVFERNVVFISLLRKVCTLQLKRHNVLDYTVWALKAPIVKHYYWFLKSNEERFVGFTQVTSQTAV